MTAAPRQPAGRFWQDGRGVTPVLGSILVLAITVVGITAVLYWGAPVVQQVQDQNAALVVESEFVRLQRTAVAELTVRDAARLAEVSLAGGTLSTGPGTRFVLAAGLDPAFPDCDLRLAGAWSSGGGTLQVDTTGCPAVDATCAVGACLQVDNIQTAEPLPQAVATVGAGTSWSVTVAGADFGSGDWRVSLTDAAGSQTYAQAWIVATQRLTWERQSSVTDRSIHLEGGAAFSRFDDAVFLLRQPPIREDTFGTGDHVVRFVALTTEDDRGVTGPVSTRVFMGLTSSQLRLSTDEATALRYTFTGDLAEAWCGSLLLRNNDVPAGASYVADPAADCTSSTPSVRYTATDPFPLEFIHARIRTQLST